MKLHFLMDCLQVAFLVLAVFSLISCWAGPESDKRFGLTCWIFNAVFWSINAWVLRKRAEAA